MAFLTIPQSARASILADTERLHGFLAAAATIANQIAQRTLALADADLAQFCNDLGPVELGTAFSLHAECGGAINSALAASRALLGPSADATTVDVRPFSDKLAAQWRALNYDATTGMFSVFTIPQPEPEEPEEPEEPTE